MFLLLGWLIRCLLKNGPIFIYIKYLFYQISSKCRHIQSIWLYSTGNVVKIHLVCNVVGWNQYFIWVNNSNPLWLVHFEVLTVENVCCRKYFHNEIGPVQKLWTIDHETLWWIDYLFFFCFVNIFTSFCEMFI